MGHLEGQLAELQVNRLNRLVNASKCRVDKAVLDGQVSLWAAAVFQILNPSINR